MRIFSSSIFTPTCFVLFTCKCTRAKVSAWIRSAYEEEKYINFVFRRANSIWFRGNIRIQSLQFEKVQTRHLYTKKKPIMSRPNYCTDIETHPIINQIEKSTKNRTFTNSITNLLQDTQIRTFHRSDGSSTKDKVLDSGNDHWVNETCENWEGPSESSGTISVRPYLGQNNIKNRWQSRFQTLEWRQLKSIDHTCCRPHLKTDWVSNNTNLTPKQRMTIKIQIKHFKIQTDKRSIYVHTRQKTMEECWINQTLAY